jgi:hypothetical protein
MAEWDGLFANRDQLREHMGAVTTLFAIPSSTPNTFRIGKPLRVAAANRLRVWSLHLRLRGFPSSPVRRPYAESRYQCAAARLPLELAEMSFAVLL